MYFDAPPQCPELTISRVNFLPHREAIKSIRHGNELLKSDLAWEARESRFITNPSAAAEIQRLQDQADIYAKKTEQVCGPPEMFLYCLVQRSSFSVTPPALLQH